SDRARALGARVRVKSRWLRAISADAPTSALRVLAQDRDLRHIQPLGRFRLPRPAPGRPRPTIELVPPIVLPPAAPADTCGSSPGDHPLLRPSALPYRHLHPRPPTAPATHPTPRLILLLDPVVTH